MASHHVDRRKVWDFFYVLYQGNEYACAGACGNMQHESGLYSDNAENLWNSRTGHSDEWLTENINNGTIDLTTFLQRSWWVNAYGFGYGLSQWTTTTRRTMLWDRTIGAGLDIDDEDAQLSYIYWEWTAGSWSQYLNGMINATSVEQATRYYCTNYEGGAWSSDRLTQAWNFYNEFAGTPAQYNINITVQGNGTAVASPPNPSAGDTVTLTCTPASGETLDDIIATDYEGHSFALYVQQVQQFTMPAYSLFITVVFSGTPPTPPTPTYNGIQRKRLPIWMYPRLRC